MGREIGIYGLGFHVTVGGLNMCCKIVRGAGESGGWGTPWRSQNKTKVTVTNINRLVM